MRTPQNRLLISNGVELRKWKCGSLLMALFLAPVLATRLSAQGISQGSPQSQVESAARSRVPRAPNSARTSSSSEGQPSTQPRVLFEDGQLTINAFDSSLADVLYALRACTGADIDLPPNASSEHVTAELGPGPARKVLSDLLSWSNFDYVIQASDNDPLSIQSVTLMVRIKGSPSTAPPPGAPGRATPVVARPPDPTPTPAPTETPEVENHPEAPVANNSGNSSGNPADSSNPQIQPSQSKGADMNPAGSGTGKSPADMIQELQQMYQQRRSIQEQQNRGPAGMPPQTSTQ
jgi:hypothetical protein